MKAKATTPRLLSSEALGSLLVLAATLGWGTTGTAQAFAPPGAHPLAIGAVRLAIGGGALVLLAAWRGLLRQRQDWPVGTTLIAAASMALYQLCFFTGVARTGVAIGTMVAIGSAPILAGALGLWLRQERPTRRWYGATVLAIAGCSILGLATGDIQSEATGILLTLGAGFAYALYAVTSKGMLERQHPDAVVGVVFVLGAVMLAPLLFFVDLRWLATTRGVAVAVELGLVATAAAYTLYVRGLRYIPVATAVTLSLGEPLVAMLLAVVLLDEQLTTPSWVGSLLIFLGLLWLSSGRFRTR